MKNMSIRKDDTVIVLSGKDKGKTVSYTHLTLPTKISV